MLLKLLPSKHKRDQHMACYVIHQYVLETNIWSHRMIKIKTYYSVLPLQSNPLVT